MARLAFVVSHRALNEKIKEHFLFCVRCAMQESDWLNEQRKAEYHLKDPLLFISACLTIDFSTLTIATSRFIDESSDDAGEK